MALVLLLLWVHICLAGYYGFEPVDAPETATKPKISSAELHGRRWSSQAMVLMSANMMYTCDNYSIDIDDMSHEEENSRWLQRREKRLPNLQKRGFVTGSGL